MMEDQSRMTTRQLRRRTHHSEFDGGHADRVPVLRDDLIPTG